MTFSTDNQGFGFGSSMFNGGGFGSSSSNGNGSFDPPVSRRKNGDF